MKKIIIWGILLGMAILSHPVYVSAESAQTTIDISYNDAQLLMKAAQAEAGNQGVTGQWLVMCVILNRVESESFPSSVEAVLKQEGQFATYANGSIDKAEPTSDTHLALAYLESGERAKNIVAFESVNDSSLEKYFWRAFSFRDHCFYTSKK